MPRDVLRCVAPLYQWGAAVAFGGHSATKPVGTNSCASYHVGSIASFWGSSLKGNKSAIILMNVFTVIVHYSICRETLNKELAVFHCYP